ncbi:hypothetical protein V3C99_018990, partial [Haemonchus contortus]
LQIALQIISSFIGHLFSLCRKFLKFWTSCFRGTESGREPFPQEPFSSDQIPPLFVPPSISVTPPPSHPISVTPPPSQQLTSDLADQVKSILDVVIDAAESQSSGNFIDINGNHETPCRSDYMAIPSTSSGSYLSDCQGNVGTKLEDSDFRVRNFGGKIGTKLEDSDFCVRNFGGKVGTGLGDRGFGERTFGGEIVTGMVGCGFGERTRKFGGKVGTRLGDCRSSETNFGGKIVTGVVGCGFGARNAFARPYLQVNPRKRRRDVVMKLEMLADEVEIKRARIVDFKQDVAYNFIKTKGMQVEEGHVFRSELKYGWLL